MRAPWLLVNAELADVEIDTAPQDSLDLEGDNLMATTFEKTCESVAIGG
jgi:hypothetical protein